MKRLMITVISVCLLAFMSVGTFAQTKEEMKQLLTGMNKEMIELVKAGRYEALGKYYDEEAVSLPNYRAMEVGYKLILNNNLGRLKGGYKVLAGEKTTKEIFIGEGMLVDIGSYTLTLDFPGLTEPKVDNGKYLNVWRKDKEGRWRIVAETWNADKSPNAPSQSKSGVSTGAPVKVSPVNEPQNNPEPQPVMDTKDGKK
ncbi:MAG: hypothetical protein MUC31_07880 [Bacteroidales bacterium]|jgi:hypothetical protein|nr:hypothetical protein [Bacteroidales bacterium]